MPVDDHVTCMEITRLHDAITAIGAKFDVFTISFAQHVQSEHKLQEELNRVLQAFPDGPDKHREAHEAMISAARAQEQFYTDLRKDLIKAGVMGALIFVMGVFVLGLKAHFMGWLAPK